VAGAAGAEESCAFTLLRVAIKIIAERIRFNMFALV
jgi:hypothetical protein